MQPALKAQINKTDRNDWHCADDAGGALPSSTCEDATQSETANAADPSQAAVAHAYLPVKAADS
jgi:hypothetical protein